MKTKMQSKMWQGLSVLLIFGLVAGLLAFTPVQQVAAAQTAPDDLPEDAIVIPGEIVVAFPTGTSVKSTRAQAAALAGEVGAQVVQAYANLALLSVDAGADVEALAAQINAQVAGAYAQPNYVYRIPTPIVSASLPSTNTRQDITAEGDSTGISWDALSEMRQLVRKGSRVKSVPLVPNDGEYAWAWDQIQADYIWDDKAASPVVCLPDTGVDYKHPDLKGKVIKGFDFYNMDKEPEDSNGHGTHLAGIISAKMNNGEETAVGVSNSKILAVKVAGSEGWGSTYTLAAGLYYCANNKSVKIINVSMGSHHPDGVVYDSLDYAINTKAKLVVAAAGNDSRSATMDWAHDEHPDWRNHPAFYPAGWADMNVGWEEGNGWVAYNPDEDLNEADNSIYQGLISVGATRYQDGHEDGSDFWHWVDTNEDDVMDEGENYNGQYCLAQFSNYGRWVNITAPGQGIYSTTPVSYPFAMNYYDGLNSGYGWLDGTSQAAAFVSGATARVWSLDRTLTNDAVKTRLIETGEDPANYYGENFFAVDEAVADPWAYMDEEKYGWHQEDEEDPNDDYAREAFCYPTSGEDEDGNANPFGDAEDMSGTRILNVAAAMDRFRIYANVRDAFTGLPLDGAKVQIKLGTKVVDKVVVKSGADDFFSLVFNNIPYQDGGVYQYQVNRKGYTAGFQTYYQFTLDALDPNSPVPGSGIAEAYGNVSVPESNANLHAVLDWTAYPWESGLDGANLDFYLWMPQDWPTYDENANGTVINRGRLFGDYQPAYDLYPSPHPWEGWDGNGDIGNLLDASMYTTKPDTPPYAQHNFERWGDDRATTESITIRTQKGYPWYTGDYTFMVTDYSSSYPDGGFGDEPNRLDIDSDQFVHPVVRLWMKGKLLATVRLDDNAVDPLCYDDGVNADFWKALTVNGKVYTTSQECGTAELPGEGDSIFPY